MLEKTLESPLNHKEIKPVNPKGNKLWIFIGKTDVEAPGQYFGHLMWKANSSEKTLMLGKPEDRRRRGRQRMRWLDIIIDLVNMNLSKLQETVNEGKPSVLQSMGLQRVGHDFSDWTTNFWVVLLTGSSFHFAKVPPQETLSFHWNRKRKDWGNILDSSPG